jgi:xanthine dehydrogenase accessory factor
MRSADREVLTAAVDWLDDGRAVWLVTVARTWGSSPRPVGSLLAICDDARFAGSVSGGCVEDDLVGRLAFGKLGGPFPRIESYGVANEQTRYVGLPCGGRLDLVVERLAGAAPWRIVLGAIERRERLARRLCLSTGAASLHTDGLDVDFRFEGDNLVKVFGPVWRLVLIGAGQLSRYVAEMALALDYEIVVCDPRPEYAAGWSMPDVRLDHRMPDDVVRELGDDPRAAVLALMHDPKLDDMALMEGLPSRAFYVGALGSETNNAKRRDRLASLGLPGEALARLHGPVGFPIGSRTPPEIAVAILAELTAVRRGVTLEIDGKRREPAASPTREAECRASSVSC